MHLQDEYNSTHTAISVRLKSLWQSRTPFFVYSLLPNTVQDLLSRRKKMDNVRGEHSVQI